MPTDASRPLIRVAVVDAIVDKSAQTRDLFDAIRRAAGGMPTLPDIASTPWSERRELDRRVAGMLARLKLRAA